MKFKSLFLATALSALAASALAHDDATLDQRVTPHGGQLRMAGPYHFELVVAKDSPQAKDNTVAIYVTDHADKPLPVKGVTAKVTLLSGKQKSEAVLSPAGDDVLKGTANYASTPDMKAVVSVTFPNGATEQARFTPLAKAAEAAADPHAGHRH